MRGVFATVRERIAEQLRGFLETRGHPLLKAANGQSVAPDSLWVGFWLSRETATALAVPDGEPADQLHVTLCYVPSVTDGQVAAVVEAVRLRAASAAPFTGEVTGSGRFDGGRESGAQDVLYAVPDLQGLAAFRQELVDALTAVGAVPSREHDFTPHVAIRYLPRDDDTEYDAPSVPLLFDTLLVHHGGREVAALPLGSAPLAKATAEAEDPELATRIARALEALDLSGFAVLTGDVTALLEALALAGARQGLLTVKALVPDAEDFALPSDLIAAWAKEQAAALVGKRVLDDGTIIDNPRAEYAIDEATRELLRGTIADAFTEEQTFAQLEDALTSAYAFSEERAALIARNEVGQALVQGNLESWKASGVVDAVEWILSDLHSVPDDCDENEGEVVALGETFPSGDEAPPLHPACLLGTVRVAAAGVQAAFRRRYAGEVVRVRAEGVPELALTPNHPVLTEGGWIPAGRLRQGDRLVHCACDATTVAALNPDDHHVPSPIEEIARALEMAGPMHARPVPVTAEAFHGDRSIDGEVDVVWAAGFLTGGRPSSVRERSEQPTLTEARRGRVVLPEQRARPAGGGTQPPALRGGMGGSHLPPASTRAARLPGEQLALARGAHRDPASLEELAQGGAVATEPSGNLHRGFASAIGGSDGRHVGVREPPLHPVGFAPRPVAEAGLAERALHDFLRDAEALRDARERLAGLVRPVEVLEVRQEQFVGHVYNLATTHGWYFAEGIVVKNCECDLIPVVGEGA